MTGCTVYRKAQEAEKLLRDGLNESDQQMALLDSASLGNIINSLVRWRTKHYTGCRFCEAGQVAESLTEAHA